MKIILLRDIKNIGKKRGIYEVSDGYAQNALIPQGLAKIATKKEINNIKQQEQIKKIKQEREQKQVLDILVQINGKKVIIKEKFNEKRTLYHALGIKEITESVKKQLLYKLREEMYTQKYTFKEAGEHIIELKAYGKTALFYLCIVES